LGRRRTSATKAILVGSAVGLAAAVASTRVLLGVHWFTDVLAGLLVGWAWFALCSIAFGGRLLRFGSPGRQAETVADAQAPV
jgi:undecaprenyl-diphosphatase